MSTSPASQFKPYIEAMTNFENKVFQISTKALEQEASWTELNKDLCDIAQDFYPVFEGFEGKKGPFLQMLIEMSVISQAHCSKLFEDKDHFVNYLLGVKARALVYKNALLQDKSLG